MELTKINEIMSSMGFINPIGPIFSKWEFVKDEILLPNRKIGSGNGCNHVYLLEDNLDKFRLCFPVYCKKVANGESVQESDCPVVTHFVMTSNLLTVGGFAYHYYDCDLNKFNYSDFANKVLREDNNGLISFDSLFKLSTDNRPYFKQFDKVVFGQIVRYTFVPKRTAYKLYMFGDEAGKNYAVFWVIGLIPDKSFIIDTEYQGIDRTVSKKATIAHEPLPQYETKKELSSVEETMKISFEKFMRSQKKSDRTVYSYVKNLINLVPRAQKMIDGQNHPSPLSITDYQELVKLDKTLWDNPEVYNWNRDTHNRASAALHLYMEMIKSMNSGNYAPSSYVEEDTDVVAAQEEKDEKQIIKDFFDFLFKEKNIAPRTASVYKGQIQNKLTSIINEFHGASYDDLFDLDFKSLIKIEEELEAIPQIQSMNINSRRLMQAAFRAYIEFRESRLTDEELAELAFG